MKRALAFLTAAACLFTGVSAAPVLLDVYAEDIPTVADSGTFGDGLSWELRYGCALKISGNGDMPEYHTIDAAPWSGYMDQITSVVISEGVTSISDYAFYSAAKLQSVTLPESLKKIGNNAFYKCIDLNYADIPAAVEYVGDNAYCYANLVTVKFGSGSQCTYIGSYAFAYNQLQKFTVPPKVTELPKNMLKGSPVQTFTLGESVESVASADVSGMTYLKNIEFRSPYTKINDSDSAFPKKPALKGYEGSTAQSFAEKNGNPFELITVKCSGKLGDDIKWTFDGETMTISGTGDMPDMKDEPIWFDTGYFNVLSKQLRHLVIEEGVTSVGAEAFWNMYALEDVTLPGSLETIDRFAFAGCEKLRSIEIPENTKSIGFSAFRLCTDLENITIYSPDCEIDSSNLTISNDLGGDSYLESRIKFTGTVTGYRGSTAERYALVNNCSFSALDEQECTDPPCTEPATEVTEAETTSTTAKPVTTAAKPTTTTKPVTTEAETTSTTAKPVTTAAKPATTTKPVTTAAKPATTAKPVTTEAKTTSTTAKPVTTAAKPVTTIAKSASTTAINTTTASLTAALEPVTTVPAPAETAAAAGKCGDANCDGKINVADAVAILQYVANKSKYELSPEGIINADTDSETGITGGDAISVQRYDAGIVTSLPEEKKT